MKLGASMEDDARERAKTERFTYREAQYAKYLCAYPAQLLDLLARETGFNKASVIADVGSGTGVLTELLLRNGNEVFGIEPNPELREVAERSLNHFSAFHSFPGLAEAIGLPHRWVDGLTVAQAYQRFNRVAAKREFHRILRPGGFIALIWNAPATRATPFMSEYERIAVTYGSEFARPGRDLVPFEELRVPFPGLTAHSIPNPHDLDWESLCGRLLASSSSIPIAGQAGHDPMLADLRGVFDRFQLEGRVRMVYDTLVYLARA